MDANRGDSSLIQSTGGSVTDFLNKRNRPGATLGLFQNLIETFVMWKDVYTKKWIETQLNDDDDDDKASKNY